MVIKQRARSAKQLIHSYSSDVWRYARWSGFGRGHTTRALESKILKDFHRIEKGLTLPQPRPWFGKDTVERLVITCAEYGARNDHDDEILAAAYSALRQYGGAFTEPEPNWWRPVLNAIEEAPAMKSSQWSQLGGSKVIDELFFAEESDFSGSISKFIRSRSSIRNFSSDLVDEKLLEECIADAQHTPSVCNRQGTRVRFYPRGSEAESILALQNGNRGFGNGASHVAVVTSDLRTFLTPGERNQGFIDGGMFAMSLIYALLARKIGTCCLNWSVNANQDRKLRTKIRLPEYEVVIMMIAIGTPVRDSQVTISPKLASHRIIMRDEGVSGARQSG